MARKDVFVFVAEYSTGADARADYEVVKDLQGCGAIEAFDAALVTRDASGSLRVTAEELPTRQGAWSGAGAAAVLGVLFPPPILVADGAGRGTVGLVARFRRGLSHADVGALARLVGVGEAALVVVAEARVAYVLERNLLRARATIERGLAPEHELADRR